MSAYLHGQPSIRAVFFRLQVILHEQDCIQIKAIGQWPVFELQSTKNIFEDSLKNIRKTHHLNRPFYSCVLSYLAMNASEAGGDLVLIQTSLLFSCKCKVVSIRTT